MTRLAARVSVATVALVLIVAVTPAFAKHSKRAYPDTWQGAQADCGHGNDPLEDSYPIKVLQEAEEHLSTTEAQYSTCVTALQAAIRADERPPTRHHHPRGSTGTGKTTAPGGGGHGHHHKTGPSQVDPITERISAAESQGGNPQRIQGVDYTPGAVTTHGSSLLGSIPTPILAVLAALLASLGAVGGVAIRNIVRARRAT
jgi:hypothetical protein